MTNIVSFIVATTILVVGAAANDPSVAALVHRWAPRVWLHSKEKFLPYNVTDYLTQVTPTLINCSTPTTCSYPSSYIPVGTDSYGYFFVTDEDRDELLNNTSSFLYGTSPSVKNSSLHAFVDTCDSIGSHFIVTYWFFYAFDYGKQIVNLGKFGQLPLINELYKYIGKSLECHVGDLERMVLEVKDGVPKSLFLSVHSIGLYYDYDTVASNFKLSYSKTNKLLKVQNPPKTLELVNGHPVVYSAFGSHGVWAAPGTHTYSKLEDVLPFLSDEVNQGTAWDTWQDLNIHYVNSSSTLPSWYNYLGHWGNPGGNCMKIPLIDVELCEYVSGPPPMSRTPDIYCSS